jgi:hypothetical protein
MQTNKVQSLQIRSEVNKLRREKSSIEDGLKKLEHYESSDMGLDKILECTVGLLQKQNSGMEIEQDPTIFPDIRNQINPQFIQLLENIKKQSEGRMLTFKDKRQQLEKLIEQSYRCIMTT